MTVSVILPSHNPRVPVLARVLGALRTQNLTAADWELILVDNASTQPLSLSALKIADFPNAVLVRENRLGLTAARVRGFQAATGDLCVLVDDDNVLHPSYLSTARNIAGDHERLGIFGGVSRAEFEEPPPAWVQEFLPMLAIRDLGPEVKIADWQGSYPKCAPIGAGMVIRRTIALAWASEVERDARRMSLDRVGGKLISGGDNDIVLSGLKQGWLAGYFPSLELTHVLPSTRFSVEYLDRMSYAMSKSWMQLLTLHRVNPWPPISRWSVPFRKAKAWFAYQPWSGPAARVRWSSACGHFDGRVTSASE